MNHYVCFMWSDVAKLQLFHQSERSALCVELCVILHLKQQVQLITYIEPPKSDSLEKSLSKNAACIAKRIIVAP